jgi:aminopeptidase N
VNLTKTDAAARAALIESPNYRIELDLTTGPERFASRTEVRFGCREVGAASFIDLVAPEVTKISLNGVTLDPQEVFHDGRIALANLQGQNELVVEASCAYSHTGEGLHRFVDPADQAISLYTQIEPADSRRVFAVFEQPDLKGVFEFVVVAPDTWRVLSNQAQVKQVDQSATSTRVHTFEPTPPLAPYLTAIAAGPYAQWQSEVESSSGRVVPMAVYARASMARYVDADKLFDLVRAGFSFYEPAFGYAYPFAKYDQIFCPEYNFGAMENPGLVTITESYIFRSTPVQALVERRAITVLHELAHMWFGDLVTMRWWDDLWLNESFAEFISHLAAVEATEWTDAWTTFSYQEKTWAYAQDQLPTTHPIQVPVADLDDVLNNFDGITYAKGASVLRQLLAWVGREPFLTGLRAYIAKYAWSNAELADLLHELEEASGRDLSDWATKWLKTAGVNTIAANAERSALEQTSQEPYLDWRPCVVAVGGYCLVDEHLDRYWETRVELSGPSTLLPKLREADLLLVNDLDLAYAKVRLDPTSLQFAERHVGAIGDSLARAVTWGVLWDMTRDGEKPAREYVERVLGSVAHETNSTGMRKLLSEVSFALDYFAAPEFRLQAEAQAAAKLWAALVDSAPASDAQLQLVRAYATHATTNGQIDQLDELVLGSRALTGLSMDTDLVWDLLGALVASGRAGEERIDSQLGSDHTNLGLERAAGLRATLPNAEAKAAAWLRAVEDPATPNGTQRAIISGWGNVRDRDVLTPFVEPYFACLERIWRDRSPEVATNIVTGLYPRQVAELPSVDVLGATDAFLDTLGTSVPALRRLVLEARAEVIRSMTAQRTDRAYGLPLA